MIIIKQCSYEYKENIEGCEYFYVHSEEASRCPYCEGHFKVIGSRKRILYKQDGSVIYLIVRRLKCENCKKISHELPDKIVPYKRYESDCIAAVLIEGESPEEDCCPADSSSISRWKIWFFLLQNYFESSVRAIMELLKSEAFVRLPLKPLSEQADGWLKVLVRNIVNSCRWRQTRSA